MDRPSLPRFEPLTTERLLVRPVRADDEEALWRRRNDPSTAAYQAWGLPYPRERARALIDACRTMDGVPDGDGVIQLSVEERDGGRVVGDLALELSFAGRCAELGYTMAPEFRGLGYATEAAAALARWCFEVLGVSRVSAQLHPDNTASARVAEHLGMVFEGHTRNSYWVDQPDGTSENSDDWHYAMTPEHWRTWNDRCRTPPESVRLEPIDHRNVHAVLDLATHRTQETLVAPMAVSLADALAPGPHQGEPVVPWARAVLADDELVGFVMVAEPTQSAPEAYLWRLLIDRLHQRRGVGSRVVELVKDQARAWGCRAIDVSWVPGPGSPEPLYRAAGFEPTGKVEDGEVGARCDLTLDDADPAE